ncbi:hypothetical protein HYT23_03120 [Candidatus Pacearchaeota archaeon]|nr:hypothetical protein [Candidatus Pacearchaeota archaeon]
MHLKRQETPKSWPIKRKGTKYLVRPLVNLERGMPLLIVLRDVLGIVQNSRELKKALHERKIMVNGRRPKNEKTPLTMFDIIHILPSKKYYKVVLRNNGKFAFEEIKEGEGNSKIAKIINKRMLAGKKTQINLSDGRNFLSDIPCNVNDSAIIDFKERKITKCLPLKEKMKAIIFSGKHSGEVGAINKINNDKKMVELQTKASGINVLIKQLMIIE